MIMTPTTIYIVEDELLIATCLKEQLYQAGFRILGTATRGDKSIEEIRRLKWEGQEPEIVLMDIYLKGFIDGIETARQLTEEFDCAIIFLTGQSSKEVYERSFFIKPFGYILKPYDFEQVIMTIEIAAYQRKLEIENREIRLKLETLLQEKERENTEIMELYRTIIDNTLLGIWVLTENRVIFANQAMAKMLGYSLEKIHSFNRQDLLDVIHPGDRDILLGLADARIRGEDPPQHTVFRVVRKDGIIRRIKSFVRAIHYHGQPALHQTFLDISEFEPHVPIHKS